MDSIKQRKQNDIIYETPPTEWWQGWLAGNGSGGATVWNPSDEIAFQLGHTDLLDRAPDEGMDNHGIPNVRHNLRAKLRVHGAPLFDPFYLNKYYARTHLDSGITDIQGKSQWGSFEGTLFYCEKPDVFVLRYKEKTNEPLVHSFELEKRGSRFFSRIWIGTEPDTSMGLGETHLETDGDVIRVTHEKEGFAMADVVKISANVPFEERISEHTVERTYQPTSEFVLEVRVCLGANKGSAKQCMEAAEKSFAECERMSFKQLRVCKEQEYAQQLPDTGICLPEDPYYENLWYASRYNMRSCYKGYYPAFFINGPFGGEHDKREWADCWLHWNMHDEILGVIRSGDWDLFHSFAEYKMRQIPSAKEMARRVYGCGGMVTQDQQKPDGGNRGFDDDYYKLQVYPCLHTSLMFYRYWSFTGDEVFLKEKLLPYLTLTLEFWKDYLVEEEGVLHIPRSHPYEFHNGYAFRDCLTDLSLLKACLNLLLKVEAAAGAPSAMGEWSEWALEHLAKPVSLPVLWDFVTREENGKRIYDNPFFFGEEWKESDQLYAIGFSERKKEYVTHCHTHAERADPEIQAVGGYGAFCSSQSAFIFPGMLVSSDESPEWREKMGKSDQECEKWENGRNALRTIRRRAKKEAEASFPVQYSKELNWTGHSLEMPAFAKLGLAEPLEKAMKFYTQNYQMFPQGMFNYHPRNRWLLDCQRYTAQDGRKIRFQYERLCQHFSFEECGVFTETVDLMLLDSSDGLIRTFPSYTKDAQFRLPADGGFTVEALQKNGEVQYVRISSSRGGVCRVRSSWGKCQLIGPDGVCRVQPENCVLSFETVSGGVYLLKQRNEVDADEVISGHEAVPQENGPVTLGLFPSF